MRAVACALVASVIGCGAQDDKADMCPASLSSPVQAADRKIVGVAAPYTGDAVLAGRLAELSGSQSARRAAAWQVVARVTDPVLLGEPRLPDVAGARVTLPRWHSWYAKDDFERMFKKLYADLGAAGRRARAAFGSAALDAIFGWNARAVEELPTWPEQRYLDYVASLDEEIEQRGVAGGARVHYSPAAVKHLLGGYARTLACLAAPEPPAAAGGAAREPRAVTVSERAIGLAACQWRSFGPYLVAPGGKLRARLAGTGDADLYVRRGAAPTAAGFDCRSRGDAAVESCEVSGEGALYVGVLGLTAATVDLTVEYPEAEVAGAPACLADEAPTDAVVVKADWRRSQFGETIPSYDTSGARMTARLGGSADWGPGDGQHNPSADQIYTARLPNGQQYRLVALHIMTKELPDWLWITLWWSPQPDVDFGEDRPAAVGGVWKNYKMCVSTGFVENDGDGSGGFGGTLGPALAAVNQGGGAGAASWCSNPYLEVGAGNADTNCIGCHQHGGTSLIPDQILSDPVRFPHHGRTRVRNNFLTDYLWAINAGDELGRAIEAEVSFQDAADMMP